MFKKIVSVFLLSILPSAVFASEIIPKLDFQDAAVIDVISSLAKREKLNLIISGDQAALLSKKATLHLTEVEAEEALRYVLDISGIDYSIGEGIVFVSAAPEGIDRVSAVELDYLSSQKAAEILSKVMPQIKVSSGERARSIILKGKGKEIQGAEELLDSLDVPVPRILIESKIIEVAKSDALRLGWLHGNPAGTFNFITPKDTKKISLASDIPSTLQALLSNGKADIIANPRIATLDNQEAQINIGDRVPYAVPVSSSSTTTQWSISYIDAGIRLKVTPHLGEEGDITANIQPEVSAISEWRTTPAGDFPVISTRNASATLRVKDGETIVIGGLMSEIERDNVVKIPILGHIPFAGLLFTNRVKQKEKTEIVFLITPYVI
ncbi:hypothetical protein A2276_01025 [candidate division WOR-1 bacterium RIFOXYA12_FULL_43_27]|nr:MAG: hypothetical protein A2276_01025 [candidate division WOR-1 bacterium RIFOXYA12_FULL_43_27]OGC20732.1 MAG: hypothetical protein A2292_06850 [candidate division WOR-1 bacterium RIFOXYB2_FULL_46_45]OGC31531.1 MAG: hypothetical protein A2232_04600 [candidate division WOR-1 bacterium RIFOXYA2_FULL_46_56]